MLLYVHQLVANCLLVVAEQQTCSGFIGALSLENSCLLLLPETMLTKLNQTVKSCGVKEKLNELKDPKTRHGAERNDRVGDNSHWVCHFER